MTLQSLVELRGLVKSAKFINIAFAGHKPFAGQKDSFESNQTNVVSKKLKLDNISFH